MIVISVEAWLVSLWVGEWLVTLSIDTWLVSLWVGE